MRSVFLCLLGLITVLVVAGVHGQDDPCDGLCHGGRHCVVAATGQAFCVDCTGLVKRTLSGLEGECCYYDGLARKCRSALLNSPIGKCRVRNALFVIGSGCSLTRATLRKPRGYVCSNPFDMFRNGLACKIRTTPRGVKKCFNADWTPDKQCQKWVQVGQSISGEQEDEFLNEVNITPDGTRLIYGSNGNAGLDESGENPGGNVRVFDYVEGTGWVQFGEDIDGPAGDGIGFTTALSDDGNRIAYSAINGNEELEGLEGSGYVEVFDYQEGAGWVQVGQRINGAAAGDFCCGPLEFAAGGNRIALATPFSNVLTGQLRIFELQGGVWVQLGESINGDAPLDFQGLGSTGLSDDGNRVVIGADGNEAGGEDAGHVRVFDYDGTGWVQVGTDILGTPLDSFGVFVAMSSDGSRIVVGAPAGFGGFNVGQGYIVVHEYDGSDWVQLGNTMRGEADGDFFGWNVAISSDGNTVTSSGIFNDGNGDDSGHSRVYKLVDGCRWVQIGRDIDGMVEGDRSGFGNAISADGTRLAITASGHDGDFEQSGQIRVFDLVDVC